MPDLLVISRRISQGQATWFAGTSYLASDHLAEIMPGTRMISVAVLPVFRGLTSKLCQRTAFRASTNSERITSGLCQEPLWKELLWKRFGKNCFQEPLWKELLYCWLFLSQAVCFRFVVA